MADLLFVVVIVAFFALMIAFVRVCERIIGPDETSGAGAGVPADTTDLEGVPA